MYHSVDNFVLLARNFENIENRGTQVAVEKDVLSEDTRYGCEVQSMSCPYRFIRCQIWPSVRFRRGWIRQTNLVRELITSSAVGGVPICAGSEWHRAQDGAVCLDRGREWPQH